MLGWSLIWLWSRPLPAEIELPYADPQSPLSVQAERGSHWTQGAYQVWSLSGNVRLSQGPISAQSQSAVLWLERAESESGAPYRLRVYLEGQVVVDHAREGAAHPRTGRAAETVTGRTWTSRFHSVSPPLLEVRHTTTPTDELRALFDRGSQACDLAPHSFVQPAQFTVEPPPPNPPPPTAISARNLVVQARGGGRMQIRGFPSPQRDETVVVITSGVNVLVDGIQGVTGLNSGRIDLEADRVVIWAAGLDALNLPGQTTQRADQPLEFYLEGNIVFRDGDRVIYADRMYYNVQQSLGVVLNAEMLTPVPDYQGLLRLKADALQQLNRNSFMAYGAALTSSRMGVPRYWFQSERVSFQDQQQPVADALSGQPLPDPLTGEPAVEHELLASSFNNFLYVGGFPVFYWPAFATDLRKPTYYVDQVRIRNDSVFGAQLLLDWNIYQLLGIQRPPAGTDWTLSTDYLSDRGFGLGTNFEYDRPSNVFGPGRYKGFLDAWGIKEMGFDDLGADRRAVPAEEDYRGRILGRHRHLFGTGDQFTAELGFLSDRNFLEQYYEREWDEEKDLTTGVELKRLFDSQSLNLTADVRLNDFFTQTEWLPRVDHFLLGQSVLYDSLTWHAHSHVGYGKLQTAAAPANAIDAAKWDPLAWEADVEGVRAATRQELDWPFELGAVKVTPYLLGEVAHWGEDVMGEDVTRAYGQAGIRMSLPIWKANPAMQSELFNLNGLAHKVNFEAELFYADANRDLDRFPLYDPLDDDAVEAFRRRFFFDTFQGLPPGNAPARFDERAFAFRSGMQSWVTAPSTEIADDLEVARLGIHQKWQTKRGAPGYERVTDWIIFDVNGYVYPEAERDNFGAYVGLVDYDFRWHVGDRLTLLSDGFVDFFADGLRTFSVGGVIGRPERGTASLFFRSIEGPIVSNIVSSAVGYRMSEKWIVTGSSTFDFGPTGNIGQSLGLTRIGESVLMQLGFNWDVSRDNFGVGLAIEPRFLSSSRLGYVGGVQIPPAGAFGLE